MVFLSAADQTDATDAWETQTDLGLAVTHVVASPSENVSTMAEEGEYLVKPKINIHVLFTFLPVLLMVLVRRIDFADHDSHYILWSFPLSLVSAILRRNYMPFNLDPCRVPHLWSALYNFQNI